MNKSCNRKRDICGGGLTVYAYLLLVNVHMIVRNAEPLLMYDHPNVHKQTLTIRFPRKFNLIFFNFRDISGNTWLWLGC